MDAKDILKRPYARRLTPQDDGGFLATIQEFPGCIADGRTADEALKNLEGAASAWIDALVGQGGSVPEPVNFHGYSGKIALRIPRGLHKQAVELALVEGASLNQFLTTAIANYVGGNRAIRLFVAETRQAIVNLVITKRAVTGREPPYRLPYTEIQRSARSDRVISS
jgi:predicted RNase H-like HicB family nuclease